MKSQSISTQQPEIRDGKLILPGTLKTYEIDLDKLGELLDFSPEIHVQNVLLCSAQLTSELVINDLMSPDRMAYIPSPDNLYCLSLIIETLNTNK